MCKLITIRPFADTDAEAFAEAVRESFAGLRPWMPWARPEYSMAHAREWFAECHRAAASKTAFEFAIVSSENRFLGGAGVNRIDPDNKRANLGYWVRTTEQNTGIATAACRMVAAWAFDNTDLIRLEVVVALGNAASIKVASKSGSFHEGVARARLLLHGEAHDANIYSIIRGDNIGLSTGGHSL